MLKKINLIIIMIIRVEDFRTSTRRIPIRRFPLFLLPEAPQGLQEGSDGLPEGSEGLSEGAKGPERGA